MTHFPILTSLIAVPIVGALLLLFVRDEERNAAAIRAAALVVATLVFALTLLLWNRFDPRSADFQFVEHHDWIPAFGISYDVGVDGISLLLVALTAFLTPLALLSSWDSIHRKLKTVGDVFDLLVQQAGVRRTEVLELVVIALIAIEIITAFVRH